jgi:hypothetical protein
MLKFKLVAQAAFVLFILTGFSLYAEVTFRDLNGQRDNTEYFAEFYSYEGPTGNPTQSHTFARFVKTTDGKPSEVVDISWLPNPKFLKPNGRMPLLSSVPGKNYTFEETEVIAGKRPIYHQGRFAINAAVFEKAKERKAFLESGKIPYKFLGNADTDVGTNCIHAVLGVVGNRPTGTKSGRKATQAVIEYYLNSGMMKELGNGSTTTASELQPHSSKTVTLKVTEANPRATHSGK